MKFFVCSARDSKLIWDSDGINKYENFIFCRNDLLYFGFEKNQTLE